MRGKIKWFSDVKGYGFIENEDGLDVFVHYTSILKDGYKSLKQNQMVEFETIETEKGLYAKDVSVITEKVNM